jgi:hypothetical protein
MPDRPDIPEEVVAEVMRARYGFHSGARVNLDVPEATAIRTFLEAAAPALRKQGAEEAATVMESLGLVRCMNCGGEGSYVGGDAPHDETVTYREQCSDCGGAGWVNQKAGELRYERDQALAKGAEEERERLRAAIKRWAEKREELDAVGRDSEYPLDERHQAEGARAALLQVEKEVLVALDKVGPGG